MKLYGEIDNKVESGRMKDGSGEGMKIRNEIDNKKSTMRNDYRGGGGGGMVARRTVTLYAYMVVMRVTKKIFGRSTVITVGPVTRTRVFHGKTWISKTSRTKRSRSRMK